MVDADKARNVATNVVEKTSDAASKSTDTINSAAYGEPEHSHSFPIKTIN